MTSAANEIIRQMYNLDGKRKKILNKLDTSPGDRLELALLNSLNDCESLMRFLNELLIEMENKKMNIEIIPVTAFQQNCSIIWDDEKNAAIIDPGGKIGRAHV